jgi:hypothetical protein
MQRRNGSFRVINVVDGTVIDLDHFSFADHVATLRAASKLAGGQCEPSLYDLRLFDSQHWSAQ